MNASRALPETDYADAHGISIAYQVFGSGAQDLVVLPGIITHLDANWQYDAYARMLDRLARSFRVICLDKRGQGLSDGFDGVPTLEQCLDDVRAVMSAAGSEKAVLFASSEAGALAVLFCATYPAMVECLVLYAGMARFTAAPNYPWRPTLEQLLLAMAHSWGKPIAARGFAPSRADDPEFCELLARFQRQTASPAAIRRLMAVNDQIDVRAVLPHLRRPTLVIHRRGDRVVACANGRYLADHIPDAVYLELPGQDHFAPEGDANAIVDAIGRFALAQWCDAETVVAGRWLATVLFTDIVGSTELAVKVGDRAWRDLLQRFHAMGRAHLAAHRGIEIDSAGDGMFATFDGPARGIRCAAAMVSAARGLGIGLRAGLHTGEVETTGDKVSGLAVHIGARVMATASAGQVHVSTTVRDLVAGSGIRFESAGTHPLKGVPGEWQLYRASVD